MHTTRFWASIALAQAPAVLAQGLRQATGGPEGTPVPWYPEPEPEISDCDANLITTLCDYKKPGSSFAVASSGRKHCMEYCNENPPCNFVIFAAGNPYTGTGTCWVYPGEDFDESLGEPGCDYLSVYDKPDCGDPTPTAGACEATLSPSAIAEVCNYPTPDETCWNDCAASSGAVHCMSMCVERERCNYAVFNPRSEGMSQYSDGTCWMYPSGKYDPKKADTCKGTVEQYVYENPCPKPPKPSTTKTTSSPTATPTKSGGGGGGNDNGHNGGDSSDDEEDSSSNNNNGNNDSNNNSSNNNNNDDSSSSNDDNSSTPSGDDDSASPSPTSPGAQAEGARQGEEGGDDSNSSSSVGPSLGGTLAVGMTVLMWQAFQ